MIRLIAIAAFALAAATSAQAMSPAPLHQADGMITQVREACGTGMHMVNGTCVRTAVRRNAARCAVGMRTRVVVALNDCPSLLDVLRGTASRSLTPNPNPVAGRARDAEDRSAEEV